MNDPLVSVVIPCYNGSAFLDGCVRSVLEQQTSCEIILVDDGSTDDSLERARALLRDSSTGMVIICQRNQGPAVARNAGLRAAQGKYVCFLDIDDLYAPDFFRTAVPIMESDPAVVAVFCPIELMNAHREVLPWQLQVIENSLASNVVVRTEAARRVGGFPTDPAFRGLAAGEDGSFRLQLPAHGKVVKVPQRLFKYRVQRGSHFDFFLDRVRIRERRMEFAQFSQEERDGSLFAAIRRYEEAVQQRAADRAAERLQVVAEAGLKYHLLSQQCEQVEGFLHPFEGFVLYWLARHWPPNGRTVEIGSFKGRSTCWLAAGCKEGNRNKAAAVDHFRGSAEHQRGGSHEDPDVAAHGSTLPVFQANLQKLGLTDWVTVHAGASADVAGGWREPVRLLFIDGDHAYEATAQDFQKWSGFVVRHGLVVFHDIGVWPGVTKFHAELCSRPEQWRAVGQFYTLGVVERLA